MNWYKIAQIQEAIKDIPIWVTKTYNEPFENALNAMYELEYKRSMMIMHGFRGSPQRQENMLKYLESGLIEHTSYVRKTLLSVLKNWLLNHALLSPQTWAKQRAKTDAETDDSDQFGSMLGEYLRYEDPNFYKGYQPDNERNRNENIKFYQLISDALNNPSYPVFNHVIEEMFLPDYKNMLYDELQGDGLEEFNSRYRYENPFETEEQAEEYIDNIEADTVDLESLMYFEDIKTFEDSMKRAGKATEVVQEFYQNAVFPMWMSHWGDRGIEDTRETIESVYKDLKKASPKDMGNFIVATQAALTVSHQTGDMIEYIEQFTGEDNLYSIMTALSNGEKVEDWNQDLKRVGVIL